MKNIPAAFLCWIATMALASIPIVALAQAFPTRLVKIVVPTPPGAAMDAISRAIAARLAEAWRQPVVVENRSGAQQILGSDFVSKSAPDGYTLLISDASSFVMNPHLYRKLPYHGISGFTPITLLVKFPWIIVVHASVRASNFQELVALARAKPGTLSYGSFGSGSSTHISVDYLKKLLGIDILHVPYKGAAPAVTDLLSGQISMMMISPLFVEQYARTGKLKFIAAATAVRIPTLPNLPTVAESGVPGYEAGNWFALMGPPGIPGNIIAKIYADTLKILNESAFREQYVTKEWFEVIGNTPEQFSVFLKSEYERWGTLIKLSGVTVE